MRYYVDGYNLLFRIFRSDEELQERRERFLEALREKVDLLNLNLIVVFDSQYQSSEGTRSGYGALEIIFTDVGVTADDCILNLLQPSQKKCRGHLGQAPCLIGEALWGQDRKLGRVPGPAQQTRSEPSAPFEKGGQAKRKTNRGQTTCGKARQK